MPNDNDQDIILQNPVRISLQRRNFVAGCEPEAVIMLFGLCAFLILVAPRPPTVVLGIITLFSGILILRRMAKRDPFMIGVLIRHFRYQNEYPAWPSLNTPPVVPRKEEWK